MTQNNFHTHNHGAGTVLHTPIADEEDSMTISEEADFTSELTGDQQNPPVETDAMGTATLSLNDAGDALSYTITVSGLDFGPLLGQAPQTPETDDDVLFAHIHEGNRGENGPVVLDIIAPMVQDDDLQVTTNSDGSVTLSGIWDADDPQPFSDFAEEFQAAPGEDVEYYFNVHSEGNPDGEIRGQIVAADAEESVDRTIRFAVAGGDVLEVGTAEIVFGGDGDDLLDASNGGGGNRIFGRDGNDTLIGGMNDRLSGNNGDDVIFAGSGGSTLVGGDGSDQFWVAYGELPSAANMILDFEAGTDVIGFSGLSNVTEFDDLELIQTGTDTQIRIADQPLTIATLMGVQATTLDSSSFVFA
jgi:Ca2+-binding RTX toxin-like protein